MKLKEISKEELKEKLELHRKWLRGEEGGIKLDLENTDLRYSYLGCADLRYADLTNSEVVNMSDEITKAIDLLKENGYIIKKMTPEMEKAAKKCEECGYEGDCLDCACSICIID